MENMEFVIRSEALKDEVAVEIKKFVAQYDRLPGEDDITVPDECVYSVREIVNELLNRKEIVQYQHDLRPYLFVEDFVQTGKRRYMVR